MKTPKKPGAPKPPPVTKDILKTRDSAVKRVDNEGEARMADASRAFQIETLTVERDDFEKKWKTQQEATAQMQSSRDRYAQLLAAAETRLAIVKQDAIRLADIKHARTNWLTQRVSVDRGVVMEKVISIVDTVNKHFETLGRPIPSVGEN